MSIRLRVLGSVVLLVVFLIGSGLYDRAVINGLRGDAKMINLSGTERVRAAKLAYLARRYLSEGRKEDRNEIEREIAVYENVLKGLESGSDEIGLKGAEDKISLGYLREAGEIWKRYRKSLESVISGNSSENNGDAYSEIDSLVFPLIERINKLTYHLDDLSTSAVNRFMKTKRALLALAAVLGVVIAFDIILAIVRPMNRLLQGMNCVAEGDLDYQLKEAGDNEFSLLAGSFNHMTENLKEYRMELKRVNKELEDFVYTVSHDLKEPLRGIASFSQFVKEDYEDKLDDRGRDYLERIIRSSGRMKELIDDLLTLSRIGRTKTELQRVSSKALVEEVMARLRFAIEEKNIEVNIREGMPDIYCDGAKIKEVFANLISNAVKFMDKRPAVLEIGWRKDSSGHTFFVRDNGIGIEARYFDKIFEIFQRLNRKEDYEGSGAGLTIVKKVVENHGGKVWVESTAGEGSIFYFSIPEP